jgi:hypothetical protein
MVNLAIFFLSSTALANTVMKGEFLSMQRCLSAIQASSGMKIKGTTTDTPDNVVGNLSNGKVFQCKKVQTGTKGTYFEGWYYN